MVSPILTDTPLGPDILSDSQVDLRNSFNYLQSALDRDHKVQFDVATGTDNQQGLHRKLSLFPTGMANPPLTPGAQTMMFTSSSDLYIQNNSNFAAKVQLTNNAMGAPSNASNGYTWLAGGMIMQWGTTALLLQLSTTPVVFPIAFSAVPYSVVITPVYTGISLNQTNPITIRGNPTALQFVIQNALSVANQIRAYWIAIGPKA